MKSPDDQARIVVNDAELYYPAGFVYREAWPNRIKELREKGTMSPDYTDLTDDKKFLIFDPDYRAICREVAGVAEIVRMHAGGKTFELDISNREKDIIASGKEALQESFAELPPFWYKDTVHAHELEIRLPFGKWEPMIEYVKENETNDAQELEELSAIRGEHEGKEMDMER
jgi:hypothetical protein